MKPTLSILTPSVLSRWDKVKTLAAKIESQGGNVEHLVLYDNKRRSIGEKRDALLRASQGDYVAFVDDDDDIMPEYIPELLKAAESKPDVITFFQHAIIDGMAGTVEFKLCNPNEPFNAGGITKRNAWHVCAWSRALAIQSYFPPSNYGEDWDYAARLCAIDNLKEEHIQKVLHTYTHSAATTEAPPPGK